MTHPTTAPLWSVARRQRNSRPRIHEATARLQQRKETEGKQRAVVRRRSHPWLQPGEGCTHTDRGSNACPRRHATPSPFLMQSTTLLAHMSPAPSVPHITPLYLTCHQAPSASHITLPLPHMSPGPSGPGNATKRSPRSSASCALSSRVLRRMRYSRWARPDCAEGEGAAAGSCSGYGTRGGPGRTVWVVGGGRSSPDRLPSVPVLCKPIPVSLLTYRYCTLKY